jgi:hypothetical protein
MMNVGMDHLHIKIGLIAFKQSAANQWLSSTLEVARFALTN